MAQTFASPVFAAAEAASQPISIQTALLLILGVALFFALKSLADLHRRVDALTAAMSTKTPPVSPAPAEGIPPEIIAVIAAATHEALEGADHQIVAINQETHGHMWSMEGRRQIFSSRKVR